MKCPTIVVYDSREIRLNTIQQLNPNDMQYNSCIGSNCRAEQRSDKKVLKINRLQENVFDGYNVFSLYNYVLFML